MNYPIDLTAQDVKPILGRHILRDGMDLVMDLERSHGAFVYDSLHNRELLDFFSCFATIPIGYNHPKMLGDENFKHALFNAALTNPTNSDIYTVEYAQFVETFSRVGIPYYLKYLFLVAGGSLAVENAVKIAMDWKVQKNFAKGYTREVGHKVLHFREAFHGRSGYTLSLTNTDSSKTRYFTKFEDWPRVLNPKIVFPNEGQNHEDVVEREKLAIAQIKRAFKEHKDDICAIIIEPIQSEGGDNHFRKKFMEKLRELADENDVLLIYDEVQVGAGPTGKFWAHQHFGDAALPDLVAFGKKMQVCGVLAGPKVDEVETNCFKISSRINSTWGGNLVDMVRATRILEIMEEDSLLDHVAKTGDFLLEQLKGVALNHPRVTNVRGKGFIAAFDLPTAELRNQFIRKGLDHNTLFLGCGERSIRFRPTLTMTAGEVEMGIAAINKTLSSI